MDYEAILKDIKPTIDEKQHIDDVSSRIMNFLQNACDSRNIDANVNLVGSVAKNTALKGKSDIDIFIAFPLDTEKQYLKDKGLILSIILLPILMLQLILKVVRLISYPAIR